MIRFHCPQLLGAALGVLSVLSVALPVRAADIVTFYASGLVLSWDNGHVGPPFVGPFQS